MRGEAGGRGARYDAPMPEGDTLHNIAKMLRPALVGKRVMRIELARLAGDSEVLVGTEITAVDAEGKNLLVSFDNGLVLHTHLMMPGVWHLYRPGESWRRSPSMARVVIEVKGFQAVCFAAPVVRVLKASQLRRDQRLANLGPDLLAETFELEVAVAGLRALGETPLGIGVMHQRAVAGVGNVYKSEVLFLEQLNPFQPLSVVTDDVLSKLLLRCRELMQANVGWGTDEPGYGKRETRFEGVADGSKVWVYRRRGQPCFRCGTKIRMKRQGEALRSTYFCAGCQHVSAAELERLLAAG